MNNINILQILKDQKVPMETKFWSPLCGEVELLGFDEDSAFPIRLKYKLDTLYLTKNGFCFKDEYGECVLYPSKDQKDWSNYKYEIPIPTLHEIVTKFKNICISDLESTSNKKHIAVLDSKLYDLLKMLAVTRYLNNGWEPEWYSKEEIYYINITSTGDVYATSQINTLLGRVFYFKTYELAIKAIEILGKETITRALLYV